jgi:hypothetical protein
MIGKISKVENDDKAQAVIILAQEQYISIVDIGSNHFTSQALSLCFFANNNHRDRQPLRANQYTNRSIEVRQAASCVPHYQ